MDEYGLNDPVVLRIIKNSKTGTGENKIEAWKKYRDSGNTEEDNPSMLFWMIYFPFKYWYISLIVLIWILF